MLNLDLAYVLDLIVHAMSLEMFLKEKRSLRGKELKKNKISECYRDLTYRRDGAAFDFLQV